LRDTDAQAAAASGGDPSKRAELAVGSLRLDQRATGVAEAVAGGLPPGSTTTRVPTFTRP